MSLVSAITPGSDAAQLGRYTLLFRFAAGGMAEVFVGRMNGEGGFEKPVAIKRMLPALADEPRFVDMFLDEARIAAMVTSPHVVPTLDVGKDDEGSPYIVMELVTGLSLSQLLRFLAEKKTVAPLPMMVEILAQTAQGLDDAHSARRPSGESLGIIHRDVSPQNVLIGVDGRARLTDFGVARALERVTRTTTGEVKGKLSYFSPEQARNLDLDQRSDVFALGVVAWESITGHRLFQRDNPVMTLKAILEEPIPLITHYRKDAPEALANAIGVALSRDRERRFQTAAAFAQALLRSGVSAPTRSELGAWVEASGGDRLKQFQSRIAQAFSVEAAPRRRTDPPPPAAELIPIEVGPAEPATRSRTAIAAALPRADETEGEPSNVVVGALAERPPGRRIWIAATAAMVVVAFAVGFFVFGSAPEPTAQATIPPEPVAALPAALPPAAPEPVTPPPTVPPAVVEATAEAAPAPETVPVPATAPSADRTPRVAGRAPVAPPSEEPSASPPPLAPEPSDPPPTEPPPETATADAPPEPVTPPSTSRRGRLLGLDQFQRETTTP